MSDDYWSAINSAHAFGSKLREGAQRRERGTAFEEGGIGAVEQAYGRQGDMAGVESTRMMGRRQRQFEDEQTNEAFDRLQNFGRFATPVLRRAQQLPPEQRAAFLNAPHLRSRFEAFGFQPEQIDRAIEGMSNPETAETVFQNLFASFGGQGLDWSVLNTQTGEIGAIDPVSGQPVMSGGRAPVNPGEWQTSGATHAYRVGPDGRVETGGALPVRQNAGGGGVQYRPVTPEEAAQYNLPNEGRGYVMGSNGRPMAATSGGGVFPAEQRARVAITFDAANEAAQTLDRMENLDRPEGSRAQSYRPHHDWGAAFIDGLDGGTGILNAPARFLGGLDTNAPDRGDYGQYRSAASSFESAILPILSGAAVTESEARRTVRATLPQVGDSDAVLRDKSRRRRQMLNGAALIGGRPPPYPELGVPGWAQGGSQTPPADQFPSADEAAGPMDMPQPGQIEDGFRFRGGDPGDPNNWEPVR